MATKINKKMAEEIWKLRYGRAESILDPFRRRIEHAEFQTGKATSWTVDHIWPKSKKGGTEKDNLQILSEQSDKDKGDLLEGRINDYPFRVRCLMIKRDGITHRAVMDIRYTKMDW